MSVELKDLQNDIQKIGTDFQEEHKKLNEIGQKNSEALEKMQKEFVDLSEQLQEEKLKVEAEQKAREQLELAVARAQEGGEGKDITGNVDYKKGFKQYAKSLGRINDEVVDQELKSLILSQTGMTLDESDFIHVKTMLVGSNPDGGYLAPVDMSSRILTRVFETSPMRSIATVETTANEARDYVLDDGEFSSGWVAELDDR
jgi:HK97 family phage major capsid protein